MSQMAVLEMEGFDHGYRPDGWFDGLSGGLAAPSWGTDTGRTGSGRSAYVNDSSTNRYLVRVMGAAKVEGGFNVALKRDSDLSVGGAILELREVAATTHIGLYRGAGGIIEARLGSSAGALLGATAVGYPFAGWLSIGVEFKIDDATGYVKVYVNGVKVIDASGVDTRNGGAAGTVAQVAFFRQSTAANAVRHDDWYWFDVAGAAPQNAYLGDCRIEELRPTAAGAASGWVGSDADSVDNWSLIDDDSSSADYIGASATAQKDLSELGDLSIANGNVYAVQQVALAAKSDTGAPPGDLLGVQRSTGAVESSETLVPGANLSTTYAWARGVVKQVDPNGDPLTIARVNGMQVGVNVS